MKPIDSDRFKQALGHFASGVTVVTVAGDDGPHGMTASAFCSVSLDPPLVLVCVKKGNTMWGKMEHTPGFAINILSAEQEELSNRFAGAIVDEEGNWLPWPEDVPRFADLEYTEGPSSKAPVLAGSLAALDCIHERRVEAGDHTIFIGRVAGASSLARGEGDPLVYYAGGYRRLEMKGGESVD